MPTYRPAVVFQHPAGETGFARVVWFYLAGKASILVEQFVRVPFEWTHAQIESECVEWCQVHAEDYTHAERLTGDWEAVNMYNVTIRCKTVPNAPTSFFVVLAKSKKEAHQRAQTRYRYAHKVYGLQDFISTTKRAD